MFSGVRVKTAALSSALLNNKAVQQGSGSWGLFYPQNTLDAAQLEHEGALAPGCFEAVTRPAMHACVAATHAAVCEHVEEGGFVWCGVDFLVRNDGRPVLLEFNIKPPSRYLHAGQFDSPVALGFARAAVVDLVELLTAEATGVESLWSERRRAMEAAEPAGAEGGRWIRVA